MRVIMLSWEYPPMRVGGIAAALEGLCPALAKTDVEIHVITSGASGGDADEKQAENLFIHRVNVIQSADNFIHWVHLLNGEMERRADALLAQWKADKTDHLPVLLHVHDWLGSYSGISLKHRYRLPMLSTIHATESGRNNGIHTDLQAYINHHEWWLQFESWRVIVCSHYMRGEVSHALGTPWGKVDILYNGVDATMFDFSFDNTEKRDFRRSYADDHQPIVFFIGRMVREKGAQVLIEAFWRVRQQTDAKLIIAGGGDRSHLVNRAYELGIGDHVYFTGRVSDLVRDKLYKIADTAVYPSLYEPFGIVALEAMAAHVPVVVTNAGGLAEVVENGISGTIVQTDNADSLSGGILNVLYNRDHARWMAGNAYERCRAIFNWDVIAVQTKSVYTRIHEEYLASDWGNKAAVSPTVAAVKTTDSRAAKKAKEEK